jgi:hypothetical protein
MYHIIAIIAGLGSMTYNPVPSFDTLEACQEYTQTDTYAKAVAGLHEALIAAGKDAEVTSVCKPIGDGTSQRDAVRNS